MLDWFSTDPFGILVIFYDKLDSQPECALGRCLLPICLFLFGSRGLFQGGLIIAPVAVRRCFRRNALQGGSVNATCDGGRQRSLPVSNRHTKSSFFFCCSAGFLFVSCLGCPGASQRHNIAPLVFQAQPTAARPAKHPFVSVCSSSLFSLFIMVLLPQAFMFSYKPPPSTPNYPPFSPHESDFVDTPRTSPSQVNNFGCGVGLGSPSRWSNRWHSVWGFLLSVALRVRSPFSRSLHSQGLLAACYKRYTAGKFGRTRTVRSDVSPRRNVNFFFFFFGRLLTLPLNGGHSRPAS